MERNIRTRFAPSPTGYLHIGNARTAIMNWLYARHTGGRFVLRIEDTDRERSTEASELSIFKDLKWLGLNWDEGPDVGGNYGPYRQSERIGIYQKYLKQLQKIDKVYPCYCTPEELEARRKELLKQGKSIQYDGKCRNLTLAQRKQFEDEGRKPVFRFKVEEEEISFLDLAKGEISFQGENIGDFVVVRSDGMPMYNFACTVDDHLMKISHVIRGDDHISNTPRQLLLYLAFGWQPPTFAHIPMILGKDRIRLSKRHGATSVSQYREMGYLPEALLNFLSLLSWSSESGDEILSVSRLIKEFSFDRISKTAPIFDIEKLDWMNGVYIRNLKLEKLAELIFPVLQKAGYPVSSIEEIKPIASLLREHLERISQAGEKSKIFFQKEVVPQNEAAVILRKPEAKKVFSEFLKEMASVEQWNADVFMMVMKKVQTKLGIKGKDLWMPVRAALTGEIHGPELPKIAEILGYEKCQQFLKKAAGED